MIEKFYEDLILTKVTKTKNEYGIEIDSKETQTVKGVINQASSKEVEIAKARNTNIDSKAYVEVTDITSGITINDLLNNYRVVSDPKNSMSRNHHYKILLNEVK